MSIFKSLFNSKDTNNENSKKNEDKNFELFKYDGIRAMHIGKIKYAIRCFEEAQDIKDDTEVMFLLANAYISNEESDKAINTLEHLLSIDEKNENAYTALAYTLFSSNAFTKMNDVCNKGLKVNEHNHTLYYLNAKAYIGLKNDIMAIAMLTKALAEKADYQEAYLLRAETLKNMGQLNDAIQDINTLLTYNSDSEEANLLKGEILALQGNAEKAQESLNIVISLNPFNEKAYLLLGNIYVSQKEFDKAIKLFNDAIDINQSFVQAYKERGNAKLLSGDKEGSIDDMKKALELSPEENEKIDGEYNNYDNITKNVPW